MQHLRISCPTRLTPEVLALFEGDPAVSQLSMLRGASLTPPGDVVLVDVAREATNELVNQLVSLGVSEAGTIHVEPVTTWISQVGLEAERHTPGSGADAVVWADVTQRAYEESELNWTYLAFMTLATMLASIAIVVDSQILTVGAMVLGPEFLPIAALGVALVRLRAGLFGLAGKTLVLGFLVAIAVTTMAAYAGRALGWIVTSDVTGDRPGTDFIYSPDRWSFVVAIIAAAAGVLSLTSAKVGGLSGVFISVTTVPAAGNVALGLAFGAWHEVSGSAIQLGINISGMVLAGWATLAVQHLIWNRMATHRQRLLAARD